jgi:NADPH:quinone reductase
MKAIVVESFGDPSHLLFKDVETPKPKEGFVLIKIKAFGVNHAEIHMRRGEWAEAMPIIGIECVGVVEACPTGEFAPGTAVAALMGGLGRTINGTYAEYTNAPVSNVVSFGPGKPPLPWHELAALPESYATAWTFLFRNLEIKPGQTLLVRGATSALGKAAVNLAVAHGVKVTGTTRNPARHKDLLEMGVENVLEEAPDLPKRINIEPATKFDAVLNLVGNPVLFESLTVVKRGGRLCHGGWLGGLAPIPDFNPLLQMSSGVHFSFFGSFVFGQPEFPVSDVPLHDIVKLIADGKFKAKPARVFKFSEIREAHKTVEAAEANGKLVVLGYE